MFPQSRWCRVRYVRDTALVAAALLLWLLGALSPAQARQPSAPDVQPQAPEEYRSRIPLLHPLAPRAAVGRALTLARALKLATSHDTGLQVALTQQREAFWGYRAASAIPGPELSLNYVNGSNLVPSNSGFTPDGYAMLSEDPGPLGSIGASSHAAYKSYQQAQAAVARARVAMVHQVKDAYYGLLAAQQGLKVAGRNLQLAMQIYGVARTRYQKGAGPRMDLINAGIQRASARQALIAAHNRLRQARTVLNPLLGLPGDELTRARGRLVLPDRKFVYAHLEALARSNPRIVEALKAVQQSKAQVALARSAYAPDPSFFYSYDFSRLGEPGLWAVGASLSIPLDLGQIRNTVRQRLEVEREKRQALNGTLLSVSSGLKGAYEAYLAAVKQVSDFKGQVLAPSERLVKITRLGFARGALPYLNVLSAEQNLRAARTQYVSLVLGGLQALDALEASVGVPLEQERKP